MYRLFMSPQVVQLSIGLWAASLSTLEGLISIFLMVRLDMNRQRFPLREGLGTTRDDAQERFWFRDRRMACAFVRL